MATAPPVAQRTDEAGHSAPYRAVGALVIGGAHGSLAVVRSLGRRGVPVWMLVGDQPIAKYSRYVSANLVWPGPNEALALDYLVEFGKCNHLRGWVLFPGGDSEARFISLNHDALSEVYRVMTPPWETLRWAADKSLTYWLANEIGVDCPWTFQPRNRKHLEEVDCRFPVIVKPTARNAMNAFTRAKAWRADDRKSLLTRYQQAVSLVGADSVLVQELIPGNGSAQFSYAAVCSGGKPVASMVARRSRQYPIDFGFTSTFVQSIELPEIEELACRFLEYMGCDGLVELEFKYDSRDGRYKLLDVNARTWAWISLGGKAGVDFPWLAWKLAMGEPVDRLRGRAGCAWAHVSPDTAAVMAEIWIGSLTVSGFLHSLQVNSLAFAAFAADDPLPGLLDLPLKLSRLWRR